MWWFATVTTTEEMFYFAAGLLVGWPGKQHNWALHHINKTVVRINLIFIEQYCMCTIFSDVKCDAML